VARRRAAAIAATRLGIAVGHTPGVLTETTADLTWALILATQRRITESERYLREQRWRYWSPDLLLGRDVHGGVLGIVGMGAIGRAVARRAAGFAIRVLYTSRGEKADAPGERVSMQRLLRESDIVSVHVALAPETRGLIGSKELALMKPTAYLVNTARGGIVDEGALLEALSARSIAGAGLDVYEHEPLPHDSPLLALPNVVLLPHVGSATVATREAMASLAVDNLLAGLRGERLPHSANPEVPPRKV
jgi:glyoxylate reductase